MAKFLYVGVSVYIQLKSRYLYESVVKMIDLITNKDNAVQVIIAYMIEINTFFLRASFSPMGHLVTKKLNAFVKTTKFFFRDTNG